MERIDGANTIILPGGGAGFQDRNLIAGTPGTTVTAKWANNVQEELVSVLTAAGIALDGTNYGQLLAALEALFATLTAPTFAGPVDVQNAAVNALIGLNSVGGTGRNYQLASNTDGTFTIYDATGSAIRMSISAAGLVNFLNAVSGPTAAPGTNTTQLATTAFVAAALAGTLSVSAISLANPGYIVFSNGWIVQWADGTVDPANNTEPNQTITLAHTFPNACLSAMAMTNLSTISGGADFVYQAVGKSASSVSVIRQAVGGGIYSGSTTWPTVWAIGF